MKAKMLPVKRMVFGILVCVAVAAQGATNGDDITFFSVDNGNGAVSYVMHSFTTLGDDAYFTAPIEGEGKEITVDYLVVAGGGGGGGRRGGGGGAGGVIINTSEVITPGSYQVKVGDGGSGGTGHGGMGSDGQGSSIFEAVAIGGGGGGAQGRGASIGGTTMIGKPGGSGGGGAGQSGSEGGDALQPEQEGKSFGYGHAGIAWHNNEAGGGGGAGAAGSNRTGGAGYDVSGLFPNIGDQGHVGGGGGGGSESGGGGSGGIGGGGSATATGGLDGLPNTGGGGGGGSEDNRNGGDGGTGIVVVRYALDDADKDEGFYSLSGNVRRLRVEDTVSLRVANGETLTIQTDGELTLVDGANLDLAGDATMTISSGAVLGGGGIIAGTLTLNSGARLAFDPDAYLTVDGTVNLGNLSVDSLVGLTEDVEIGTYTLIGGDSTSWDFDGLQNWGETNKVALGESGNYAYLDKGNSLQLVVIPEPHTIGLLLSAAALLALRRRRG